MLISEPKKNRQKRRATPKFLSATRGDRKTIAGTVRCKHPAGTAMANLICLLSPSKRSTKKKGAGEKNKIQRRTKTCQEREKNPNRCQASETQNRTFRIAGGRLPTDRWILKLKNIFARSFGPLYQIENRNPGGAEIPCCALNYPKTISTKHARFRVAKLSPQKLPM